jgi:protein-S-isoprenylcysteine O-methyltransferase Ste14
MNLWFAKATILLATTLLVVIWAPHGRRSRTIPVAKSRKRALDVVLLAFAWVAFFLTLLWGVTPVLAFADYPLRPFPLFIGDFSLALGLWLYYRSHSDLGTNWSSTLEVRQKHKLVTRGVYRLVRHPMYLSFLLYSVGEVLVVPNRLVGPSYGVAMTLVVSLRLGPEERMLLEEFGKDYQAYVATTKRLIPLVW